MMTFILVDMVGYILESIALFPICFIPLILIAIIYQYKKKKDIQPSMGHLKGLFIALTVSILYTLGSACALGSDASGFDENVTQYLLRSTFAYSYFPCLFYLLLVLQRRRLRACVYFLCFLPYLYILSLILWIEFNNIYIDGCLYELLLMMLSLPPVGLSMNEVIGAPIGEMTDTFLKFVFLIVLIVTVILEAIRFHRQKKSMKQQNNLLQDHQESDETTKTDK